MNKLLLVCIALGAVFTSCEETGFTLNPKQVHVQVLDGDDFIINVKGNGKDLNLTEQSPANGFNVKKDQTVLVTCVQGDSVLVLIAGDIRGNFEDPIYMSEGEDINLAVD